MDEDRSNFLSPFVVSDYIFIYIYILMIQIFSGDGMYILNNANEIEN